MNTKEGYGGYPARPKGAHPIVRGIVDLEGVPEKYTRIYREFNENLASPFIGLTTDGVPRPWLYPLKSNGLSTAPIAERAGNFLGSLSEPQRENAQLPVDANEWRAWINAFAARPPHGILLDDLTVPQRDAAMAVIESAMSERGFNELRTVMRINEALAEVAGGYEDTLREWMYWFAVFGEPSADRPWGFQMFGHHACINVFVVDGQLTIGPMFLGAEPRVVVSGPHAGTSAFDAEMELGLELMRSLTPEQKTRALLSPSVQWEDLPAELAHPTEGRMRGSAARDNAVVPYEGICGAELNLIQRERLRALLGHYAGRLPEAHASLQMDTFDRHINETYFTWAGEIQLDKPFYYKVHSPVIFIEIDAHMGIFIANDDPEPFHIHNIVRIPNGNDYGRAYLHQFEERQEKEQNYEIRPPIRS